MSAHAATLRTLALALAAAAAAQGVTAARAQAPEWFADARYRYEWVDEGGFDENANASTLRSRIGLQAMPEQGFRWRVEGANVVAIGPDEYNAGAGATPDRAFFPVVADPEDTRLNRAWLGWRWTEGIELRAGRHRIKLDNDRFVGNVGWRQNEQTYDGLTVRVEGDGWSLFYGGIARVQRIFDSDRPAGRHDHRTHLLNASRELAPGHRLTGYLYRIDDRDQPALSNRTVGLRYAGAGTIGSLPANWWLEAALQDDTGSRAPVDVSAEYLRLELAVDAHAWARPRIGFERLGGSARPGRAFRTPLATLHAFNGWADRFLTTPDAGLDDLFLGVHGTRGRWAWQLIGHDYRAERGDTRFGRELDASLSLRLSESASLLLKAARFEAESEAFRDATKIWTQLALRWP